MNLNTCKYICGLVLSLGLCTQTAVADARQMKALYHIDGNKLPSIHGVEYPVKQEIYTIFAVPEKGAVGTNALNNAITLLKFKEDKIKYDIVSKDFIEEVFVGRMVFLPEFSDELIGYSQTRGFLLFNLKDKTFNDYIIGKLLEITIDDIAVIDAEKRLFLFQLNYMLDIGEKIKVLKLIDLSTETPKELASYDIEKDPLYAQLGKTTFHFTEKNGKRKLHALNEKLEPIDHPLYSVYNNKSDKFGQFGLPYIHPDLSFAVIIEDNPDVAKNLIIWVASWRQKDQPPEMYKIFGDNLAGEFKFSPDGKWALFQDDTVKPNMLMVMPVDPNLSHFLGAPVMLQCNDEMPRDIDGKHAWISNPLSFVISLPDKLVKWEISQRAINRKVAEQ